jgi:hypothetical protein
MHPFLAITAVGRVKARVGEQPPAAESWPVLKLDPAKIPDHLHKLSRVKTSSNHLPLINELTNLLFGFGQPHAPTLGYRVCT